MCETYYDFLLPTPDGVRAAQSGMCNYAADMLLRPGHSPGSEVADQYRVCEVGYGRLLVRGAKSAADATQAFVDTAFRVGSLRTTGTAIIEVLPPMSRFSIESGHGEKKLRVIRKLGAFFERFFGLSSGGE